MSVTRSHHVEVLLEPRVLYHGSSVPAHQHGAMGFKDMVVVERVESLAIFNGSLVGRSQDKRELKQGPNEKVYKFKLLCGEQHTSSLSPT